MHQIEITNFNPSDLPMGGPFDFRIGRGSTDLANLERADDAGQHTPLSPPALLDTNTGRIVIHGHRQIDAAVSNGLESIPALVYPRDTSTQTVVALALEQCETRGSGGPGTTDETRDGTLSGIEKIFAIYKTSLYAADGLNAVSEPLQFDKPVTPPDWIVPLYAASLLGRRVSSAYLAKICRALAFPESEILALERFRFSIDQIASLLVLSARERAVLLELRSAVVFTAAETRQLVRLFVLSRGRAKFSIDTWAAAAQEKHTKGSAIIGAIEEEIHPTLTSRRRRIETALREMRLPNRVRITPPENLEGDSFSCYFRFSRIEEFDGYVKLLGRVVQDGDAGRLLDLLNDDVADTEAQ